MRKTAPVWRGTLMESDLMPPELKNPENWTLFDFESVFAAFREDTVFGSEMYNNTIGLVFGPTILGMHGKQHHDHRSLVAKAFRQSALVQWEPEVIDPICDQLVDEFKNDGHADLVKAVTFEFPTRVTAALLGLPQEDLEMFRRLSLDLISITEDIEAGLTASVELGTYFQEQVDQRRASRPMTHRRSCRRRDRRREAHRRSDHLVLAAAAARRTGDHYRSSGNLLYLLLTIQTNSRRSTRTGPDPGGDRGRHPLRDSSGFGRAQHHSRRRDARQDDPGGGADQPVHGFGQPRRNPWNDPDTFDIHRPRRATSPRRRYPQLPRHAPGTDGNEGHAQQPFRPRHGSASWCPTTSPRSSASRSVHPPPSRDVPSHHMKSRAAILHDIGRPWSVEDFELDPPRAGEALVEMAAAGLCHSDDHILKGDMSAPNEVMQAVRLPLDVPHDRRPRGRRGWLSKSATASPISRRAITS